MSINQNLRRRWSGLLALGMVFSTVPAALAQTANFGSMTLSPNFPAPAGISSGYTGGSFSLPVIANRDRNGNLCLGFADTNPDHIMVLQSDFTRLQLEVASRGETTILVQGPNDGTIRCGAYSRRNRSTEITDTNWPAGTYRIWVGAVESGARHDYSLTVRQ